MGVACTRMRLKRFTLSGSRTLSAKHDKKVFDTFSFRTGFCGWKRKLKAFLLIRPGYRQVSCQYILTPSFNLRATNKRVSSGSGMCPSLM